MNQNFYAYIFHELVSSDLPHICKESSFLFRWETHWIVSSGKWKKNYNIRKEFLKCLQLTAIHTLTYSLLFDTNKLLTWWECHTVLHRNHSYLIRVLQRFNGCKSSLRTASTKKLPLKNVTANVSESRTSSSDKSPNGTMRICRMSVVAAWKIQLGPHHAPIWAAGCVCAISLSL